jgi:tetratricopeptide (TPR) repeat protein
MLPPDIELVGRDADLDQLRRFLAEGTALADQIRTPARISIIGEAGVGKSALATRFAYMLKDDFPDGALYVDLNAKPVASGVVDTAQILRSFLLELGHNPDRLPQDAQRLPTEFHHATDDKRLIVFLDNVINYQSVQYLVPRSPTCLVIFTSLSRLGESMLPLRLKPLSDDDAVELFGKIAPSRDITGEADDAQLVNILRACEGLPIAIRVLAARLEDNPDYTLDFILQYLHRYQSPMTPLFGPGRETIEACFRVSYNALTDAQSRLFRRLSLTPGESFDVPLADHLSGLKPDGSRQVLEDLCALQLIQSTQDPDYFMMHSLWRHFAREELDDEAEAAEQLERILKFYCEQAEHADGIIRSVRVANAKDLVRNRDLALVWMEKQHKNLVAAVKRACESGEEEIAWRTCRALVEFFEIRGKWESWGQTHETAKEMLEILDRQGLGMAHVFYGLGRLNGSQRHWPEAIDRYRAAVSIFRQLGERVQEGSCLNSLGDAYRYMRSWDPAENCFRRSLEILEQTGSPRQIAIAKRSMSTIYRLRGQFADARKQCLEAIEILEGETPRSERWIAATKLSLADIYLDSGTHDARPLLEECLPVFEGFGDSHWLLLTRRSLGEALREEGDYEAALEQLATCQASFHTARDEHWEGQILHSMGLVYLDRKDTAQATTVFGEALKMFKKSRDTLWEGRTHVSIGRAAAAAGRATGEARVAYNTAWPLLVEQGAKADIQQLERLEVRLDKDSAEPNG